MIIVEGMDNTGKTTLIETLAKHFNLPTVKSYRPFTREDIYALHSWISAAPQTVITDRHPSISDLVYGPTIRGSTPSSLKVAKSCRMNNYLIFCRPSTGNVFGTLGDRDQMGGVRENQEHLLEAYDQLMKNLEPNFLFNYTDPSHLPKLIKDLTHELCEID